MKNRFIITVVLGFLTGFLANSAFAGNNCPQSAGRLQDFAGCIAQVPGGAVLRSNNYGANLDSDHKALLSAMHANSGVPPQVTNGMSGVMTLPMLPFYPSSYFPPTVYYASPVATFTYYYGAPAVSGYLTAQYRW